MRYFLCLVAVVMTANFACSSFKNKDGKQNQGSGDALGNQDGDRVDNLNPGANGGQVDEDERTIEVTANGQADILTVDGTSAVEIAWEAVGFDDCELTGSSKKGLKGAVNMGVITSDTRFTVICSDGEVSEEKSVDVKIEPKITVGPDVFLTAKRRNEPSTAYVSGELTVDYETNIDLKIQSVKKDGTAIYACFLQPLAMPIQPDATLVLPVNNLTQTTIYSFQCEDINSVINTVTLKVNVKRPPPISAWIKVNNVANKTYVNFDTDVNVTWQALNASQCIVSRRDSDPLEVLNQGSSGATFKYHVTAFTILDLSCTASGGRGFETSVAIHVNGHVEGHANLLARIKGTGSYVDGPLQVQNGDDVEVKWSSCVGPSTNDCVVDNSVDCKVITPFHGQFPPNGTENTSNGVAVLKKVSASHSILLSCLVPTGVAHDFLTIQVAPAEVPTASITANGKPKPANSNEVYTINVNYGDDVAIDWSSTGAKSCVVQPLGFNGLKGHMVVQNLTATTVMTLICTGPGGNASDSVVIRVPGGGDVDTECKTESCWNKKVTQACAGDARETIKFTLTMPRVGPCQFDTNGNLGPFIGNAYLRLRAAEKSDLQLDNIPTGSALCSASIDLANRPGTNTRSKLFYNDQFFQLMSGALISTSIADFTSNLNRAQGMFVFNKSSIIGDQGYNVDGQGNFPHYCAAADSIVIPGAKEADKAACVAPAFNINEGANLGAFSQKISDGLGIKLSTYKIVNEGMNAPFTYSLGAFGDQNSFDCTVGSNFSATKDIVLEFTVDYAPLAD